MSIREEKINGIYYKIGTMSRVGREKNIETGKENDISTFNLLVPTYGAWAGPEWAANVRAPRGSNIKWDYLPCYKESIKNYADPEAIDPVTGKQYKEKCYSVVDAITKHHDWDYEKAEHDVSNEASLKMTADIEMLNSVALAQQKNGAYTYPCVSGTGIGYKPATETTINYTATSLDSTENKYAGLLSIAFTLKLVSDALCVGKEAVVNTFNSIWDYVTGALGTNKITSIDGNETLTAQGTVTDGVTLSCYVAGNKVFESAWVLDTNSCKAIFKKLSYREWNE